MLTLGEFDTTNMPVRRDGMTSVQVMEFLRAARPEVPHWVCWLPRLPGVDGMVGKPDQSEGTVGAWRWRRVACPYAEVTYFEGKRFAEPPTRRWTGLLEVTAPGGETFLLFSYLDSAGMIGSRFFVSTVSEALLERFCDDAAAEADRADDIRIGRVNAEDIVLNPSASLEDIVRRTRDWSFAYMNELRASAGILAIRDGCEVIGDTHLRQALQLLGTQFDFARRWHVTSPTSAVGFAEAQEEQLPGLNNERK